jgi:hypothetical protein
MYASIQLEFLIFALDRVLRKHLRKHSIIKQAIADTLDDKHPLRMRQIVSQMRDIAYIVSISSSENKRRSVSR